MADSRDKYGEYGGKPGSIHSAEDGHEQLEASEKARILRTYGIRNSAANTDDPRGIEIPSGIDAGTGEKWEDAERRNRALHLQESRRRLSNRTIGEVD